MKAESCKFVKVYVTFLLPPGIKGLNFFLRWQKFQTSAGFPTFFHEFLYDFFFFKLNILCKVKTDETVIHTIANTWQTAM